MPSQVRKLKIGIFFLSGLFIAAIGLIWIGSSRYFQESKTVVSYFTESVQGLESDSPVKFRGVPVGRVKAIRMAPDGRLIEVVMVLIKNFKLTEDLGVKMNLLGLTGLKYIEMDTFRPDQAPEMIELDFKPAYHVIATYPSDIKEIGNALEKMFQKINALDVDRLSHNLLRISARLDKILADPKLDVIGSDAAEAIKEIKEASKKINEEISRVQLGKSLNKTLDKVSEFIQESTDTIRSADRAIRRADNNINRLSQKLERSADNLVDFTRMIRSKPSSILFGGEEKPQPKR
ncbi:MAG: phospholipid/cholesterol/gamma-HCH transport system substrate-binding protein [Thermodesulfobacteriota bacterium]|nr:phospholipid/cholesterol/gamma-HCH transport system substrate-binding protein [Thermodesulfobacteriota bacterium]